MDAAGESLAARRGPERASDAGQASAPPLQAAAPESAAAALASPSRSADETPAARAGKPRWQRPGLRTGLRERIVYPLRQMLLFGANRIVGHLPSHDLRLAYYRHALGWRIGKRSHIHTGLELYGGRGRVTIGDHSTVQIGCLFVGVGIDDLVIGNNVAIAYRTTILLGGHDVHSAGFELISSPVVIEDDVFIGANALIMGGVTLGRGAVVGAGAVVGKSVAPYTIVAGNPAKPVGERRHDLDYSAEHRWPFH